MEKINEYICRQFGNPQGMVGRIAGLLMARRNSNRERTQQTLELLGLKDHDRLLEIGFGPGLALESALLRFPTIRAVGIDHSALMVQMASKRNQLLIRTGRLELRLGSTENLPLSSSEFFDKIFSINSFHFWPQPDISLRRLRESLKPGGLIAFTHQPRSVMKAGKDLERFSEELLRTLQSCGFKKLASNLLKLDPPAVCVRAVR